MTIGSRQGSSRRFVLETLDYATECPIEEVPFEVDDIGELCTIIDAKVSEIVRFSYDLDPQVVGRLKARFKIAIDSGNRIGRLRGWHPLDDLPYKVHTNRELALMLKGSKPLAYFSGQYPDHPEVEEIPERLFDKHVAAGWFVKREYVVPIGNREAVVPTDGGEVLGTRHVMYALPGNEW